MAKRARAANTSAPVDYDLTCWYLNRRRVVELTGIDPISAGLRFGDTRKLRDHMANLAELASLKEAIVGWLQSTKPPTLGQLLIKDALNQNMLFTHFTNYFGRGLPAIHRALERGKADVPMAELYAKLDELRQRWRLSFRFHHEHLTSTSAWTELGGQHQLFALGLVTKVSEPVIEAIPYVIASPFPKLFEPATAIGQRWQSRLQVPIEVIDSFAKIADVPPRPVKTDLERLRRIPEKDVKRAFAEIIGEPSIPKDWGGERSDLYSDRLVLDGDRVATAFIFKGPAHFAPLTPADLGKNGDQIDRLFSEPADMLVLQHCHEITPAVRGQMRAYAQQIGNLKLFCLIDGYDTMRLLRAYRKCGL
jgi:hypothetical protein